MVSLCASKPAQAVHSPFEGKRAVGVDYRQGKD
jgi:hypothetical protein